MGEVVPFGRPAKKAARPGPSTARTVAIEQNRDGRAAYADAALRQSDERLIAAGRVVPARISMAMNLGGHEGPAVDLACGTFETNPDGDVDAWEEGTAVPGPEQVRKMAAFTGFPEVWFYRPMPPGPLVGRDGEPGFIWMCGPRGCTAAPSDWVDEHGVLHYGAEGERKPRRIVQGALPIDVGPSVEKPRQPAPRKATPAKKATAGQPKLPPAGRMPEHLRAGLVAKGVLGDQRKP